MKWPNFAKADDDFQSSSAIVIDPLSNPLHEDLSDFLVAAEKYELNCVLMSGGLLALTTTGEFFPDDPDIDFGCLIGVSPQALTNFIDSLRNSGWSVRRRTDPLTLEPNQMLTFERQSRPIDLKFYSGDGAFVYRNIFKGLNRSSNFFWRLLDVSSSLAYQRSPKSSIRGAVEARWRDGLAAALLYSGLGFGFEVQSREVFLQPNSIDWHGVLIPVPRPLESYLEVEYALRSKPDSVYLGGWSKPSHVPQRHARPRANGKLVRVSKSLREFWRIAIGRTLS